MKNRNITEIAEKVKKRTGKPYIMRGASAGTMLAEFSADNWPEYTAIQDAARRIRGVHVETHFHSQTVWVWNALDWETHSNFETEKKNLVDGFWEALHNYGREAADKYFTDHHADYVRLGIC